MSLRIVTMLALCLAATGAAAQTETPVERHDRHTGYYYPVPQHVEEYTVRSVVLPEADRSRRIGFVTAMTNQMLNNPYPPPFAVYAKGTEAEKLIIVGLEDDRYDTLYRARALLAQLTAVARTTPVFTDHGVEDYFTFFDLLNMLGFEQLTISDGDRFAHQVIFKK